MLSAIRIPARISCTRAAALAFAFMLIISSCAPRRFGTGNVNTLTAQQWRNVAAKKIFFAHQSIGSDIVKGIADLQSETGTVQLNIVESGDPQLIRTPALVHARVGTNGDPRSKWRDFENVLDRGMGREGGVALLKFCFADVAPSTDLERLFSDYRARVSVMQERYPKTRIVHVTMPLTLTESRLKYAAKKVVGRTTDRELNAMRNRFNDLLRSEYSGKAPIFDLATVESTHGDGTRSYVGNGSVPVFTLASEYTNDGAHLNERGRRAAAIELLKVIAEL